MASKFKKYAKKLIPKISSFFEKIHHSPNPKAEYQEIVQRYGSWTAHNINLGNGLFTIKNSAPDRAESRAVTYQAITELFFKKKISGIKILDLGCLEGSISINFAKLGAYCTGVDIRDVHLRKAEFASKTLSLNKHCKWIKGDVTEDTVWSDLPKFDVIICSGILYHMDANSIIPLLRNIHMKLKSNGLAIIDTNISHSPVESVVISDDLEIWGRSWIEHPDSANNEEKLAAPWSSYKNNTAFWMTERSLTNALTYSGFAGVFRALMPYQEWGHQARDIWIAIPGKRKYGENLNLRVDPDNRPINHPGMQ